MLQEQEHNQDQAVHCKVLSNLDLRKYLCDVISHSFLCDIIEVEGILKLVLPLVTSNKSYS